MRASGRLRVTGLALAIATGAGAVAAASPAWRLDRAAIGRSIGVQVAGQLGLDVRVTGPVSLKLLPRPRLRVRGLSASGSDGAILVDVPEVKAELDIASLLRGRWRLASATLVGPTVTVDVDRVKDPGLFGNGRDADRAAPPLRLKTRSGVLRTVSASPTADLVVTDADVSVSWPSAGGPFSASGTVAWRGAPARFAARVEHLSDLAAPSGSTASLQITSPTLTLSADGVVSGEPHRRFAGHVAALVPSLPKLLQLPVESRRTGVGRLQIGGDVVASAHGLSFSDATFRTNRGRFEGTLAIRRDDARMTVEGTLATDLLDVDTLLADGAGGGSLASLYRRPLVASALDADVDLRVSASEARLGRLTLDDAAFAVLYRDRRLDLTLDEAGLCGGRIKGRMVARLDDAGAVAHAEATSTRVDVAALSAALGGDGQVGGALTGEATLEGSGRSLSEIVASLGGRGQITVEKGRLAGLSLGRALSRFGARLPIETFRGDRPTIFDRAVWMFSVDGGILKIPDGKLTAPGVAMSFSGQTRLPDGQVDIAGTAVETDPAGTLRSGSPRLPFTMEGSWDGSLVLIGHPGASGLPSFVLPLFGAAPPAP